MVQVRAFDVRIRYGFDNNSQLQAGENAVGAKPEQEGSQDLEASGHSDWQGREPCTRQPLPSRVSTHPQKPREGSPRMTMNPVLVYRVILR